MNNQKLIITGIVAAVILLVIGFANPISYNEAGSRTVVTQYGGDQFVEFQPGVFYSGFFSRETEWPNRIIISYLDSTVTILDPVIDANKVEIGLVEGMFSDGPTAKFKGVAQFNLPTDRDNMLEINNDHKTPENLIEARLSTYLMESLNSACQLMNSETHYSGGKTQMAQDYLDQMRGGIYIVKTTNDQVYDSLEKSYKRVYASEIVENKDGSLKRKSSSIKSYGITVGDASIAGVEYSKQITQRLRKKIDAATDASISKQELMTAEQKKLTAAAQGEQKLTEIKYKELQSQTIQVVQAQTKVELAKQDLAQQEIARQAAEKEAAKIKTLADAEAYAKQRVMTADGALDKKLATYEKVQGYWADALSRYTGNITPMYMTGGSQNGDAFNMFMQTSSMKAMKDLNLDMKNK